MERAATGPATELLERGTTGRSVDNESATGPPESRENPRFRLRIRATATEVGFSFLLFFRSSFLEISMSKSQI